MEEIIELTKPKTESLAFKVSVEDKETITKFCEDNNFRLSAFLRVSVLKNIQELEDDS